MAVRFRCDIDFREETLEDLKRRQTELHVPYVAEGGDTQDKGSTGTC